MPNKVDELEARICQLKLEILTIQLDCIHDMKTAGLLYTAYYNDLLPPDKKSSEILINEFTGTPGFYCYPQMELEMSACKDVFSIAGPWQFYTTCSLCNKKEEYCTHDVCFYCLHKLGKEVKQDNLEDYFKEHPKSATEVSLKECPNCHRRFAWYRWDTDEDFN